MTDNSRQQRIQQLFSAVMQQTQADRCRWLAEQCTDDEELLREVLSLLEHAAPGDDPLELGIEAEKLAGAIANADALAPTEDYVDEIVELTGNTVGPYKLLQRIGEGGMGTVYMAEQERPFRRRVAVKIIKPGLDTKQVIARFEAERQALAMMDHHNIARVLDAGATESGHPYFAMELVKGIPVTQYCDDNKLMLQERLDLFVPVCHAIQHAHQKGIIHRDIKPSNVLVCLYDGVPVPKIIDFGVAKATHQKLTEKTMFTALGQVVGTLEYMSPEQSEMNQLDVDTRTDIYSLGVMLYELLTGSTPITRAQLKQIGFEEILKTIREKEPPKPSTRLSESGDALPRISSTRRIEPARLSKLLRGDLDWIVMKALEKDRTRRYETANGLALDIKRYLEGDPVEAGPPSATYRLKKFATRNKSLLATATFLATVLVGAVVISTWMAIRAFDAEAKATHNFQKLETEQGRTKAALSKAEKERDRAIEAENTAERVSAAQQDTIESLHNFLYAADLRLAGRELDAGHFEAAERLLTSKIPEPGEVDRRCFAWHMLMKKAARYRGGVRKTIARMVLDPDGRRSLELSSSVSTSPLLELRELTSDEVIAKYRKKIGYISDIRFSPDGLYFAMAGGHGVTGGLKKKPYHLHGIEVQRTDRPEETWKPPEDIVLGRCVDFHPDQPWVVASAGQHAEIWNYETDELVKKTSAVDSDIDAIRFINDGQQLVIGAYGGFVSVYDTAGGELSTELIRHTNAFPVRNHDPGSESNYYEPPPVCLEVSPDGSLLAESSNGPIVRLWDLRTLEQKGVLEEPSGIITSVQFARNGQSIYTGTNDRVVRRWDVASGYETEQWTGLPDEIKSLLVSADGKTLHVATDGIQRFDIAEGKESDVIDLTEDGGIPNIVTVSPNGQLIATADLRGKTRVHDLGTGRLVFELENTNSGHLEFTPDSSQLLVGWNGIEEILVYSTITGKQLRTIPVQNGLNCISLSADGQRLALGHHSTVDVVDFASGKKHAEFRGQFLRYSPDGDRFAVWSDEGLAMYDATSQQRMYLLSDHGLTHVSPSRDWFKFSPNGRVAAAATNNRQVFVFDTITGKQVGLFGGQVARVTAIAFCGDGKTLAASGLNGRVTFWDLVTGQPKAFLEDHHGQVNSVDFSFQTQTLVSVGYDSRIRLTGIEPYHSHRDGPVDTAALASAYRSAGRIKDQAVVRARGREIQGRPAPPRINNPTWLRLDGESTRFRIPSIPLDSQNGLTVEAWLRPQGLRSNTRYGDGIFYVWFDDDNFLELQVSSEFQWHVVQHKSGWWRRIKSPIRRGRDLVHVAVVRTAKELQLYVDGALIQTTDVTEQLIPEQADLFIGGPDGASTYIGMLDELRISDGQRYTQNFTPSREFGTDATTLALYHFDRNEDGVAWDASEHKRHVVLLNPQWVDSDNVDSVVADAETTHTSDIPVATLLTDPPPRSQDASTVLLMDGKDSGFRLSDAVPFNESEWTVEGWFLPTGYSGDRYQDNLLLILCMDGQGDTSGISLKIDDSLRWRLSISDGQQTIDTPWLKVQNLSQLVHVALVFHDDTVSLYIDGIPRGRLNAEILNRPSAAELLVGRGVHGRRFVGFIDEICISRTARYKAAFDPEREFKPDEATVALYHFDANRQNILWDASGHRRHQPVPMARWRRLTGSGEDEITANTSEPAQLAMMIPGLDLTQLPEPQILKNQDPPARLKEHQTCLEFDGEKGTFGLPELILDPYAGITFEFWARSTGKSESNQWGDLILLARTGRAEETWFQMKVDERQRWHFSTHTPGYEPRGRHLAAHADEQIEFIHMAATMTRDRMSLYVDGKWVGDADISDLRITDRWHIGLAGYHDGNAVYKGLLDELRISRSVRYSEDFEPVREFEPDDKTVLLYHFDANPAAIAWDHSGNNHHTKMRRAMFVATLPTPHSEADSATESVIIASPDDETKTFEAAARHLPNLPLLRPVAGRTSVPTHNSEMPQTALECNGRSSGFLLPKIVLNTASGITMEAWVRSTAIAKSKWGGIAMEGQIVSDPSARLVMKINQDQKWFVMIKPDKKVNGAAYIKDKKVAYAEPIEDTPWTHVATVLHGESLSLFVDGKRVAQGKIEDKFQDSQVKLSTIAGQGDEQLIGFIDEVRISSTARYTDDFERQREFEPDEHTVILYHFDQNDDQVIYDHSGNNHHVKHEAAVWATVE